MAAKHQLRHLPNRAGRFFNLVVYLVMLPGLSSGQSASVEIPPATPLSVELTQHVPMKAGAELEGRLLYPVYAQNRVALPAGTLLRGSVVELDPDRERRVHARLRGDFTPFHIPVVRFDQLILADGTIQPFVSDITKDGAPILRLSPPPVQKKGSFINRQIALEKQHLKDAVALVTAPGRGDRFVQFLYTQLPYHPERIERATSWTVELAQPLDASLKVEQPEDRNASLAHAELQKVAAKNPHSAEPPSEPETEWRLRAYLQRTISSANEKPGNTFQALVSEPVFNAHRAVVIPQGSVLVGEITRAKAARSFGRQGKLRFRFRELKLPSGFSQPVDGSLTGVDSDKSANLQIDSEGGIAPKSQNRVIVPLVLTLLASRAFDNDDGSQVAHNAVASNGLGIIGRVVGMAAGSSGVAAGIGLYGAGLSLYDLWLARGHDVVFVKNTRVEITTKPSRNPLTIPRRNDQSTPRPSR